MSRPNGSNGLLKNTFMQNASAKYLSSEPKIQKPKQGLLQSQKNIQEATLPMLYNENFEELASINPADQKRPAQYFEEGPPSIQGRIQNPVKRGPEPGSYNIHSSLDDRKLFNKYGHSIFRPGGRPKEFYMPLRKADEPDRSELDKIHEKNKEAEERRKIMAMVKYSSMPSVKRPLFPKRKDALEKEELNFEQVGKKLLIGNESQKPFEQESVEPVRKRIIMVDESVGNILGLFENDRYAEERKTLSRAGENCVMFSPETARYHKDSLMRRNNRFSLSNGNYVISG